MLTRSWLQHVLHVIVILLARPREGCGPRRAGLVRISTAVQQQFCYLNLSPACGVCERRRTILIIDTIDIRSMLNQQTRFRDIAGVGHVVQQREATPVGMVRIHPSFEQKTRG